MLTVSGEIRSTTVAVFVDGFVRAMLEAPFDAPIIVSLNSQGGNARAAHKIADAIHAARGQGAWVETRVETGAICLSASPLMFSAGEQRMAGTRSVFLFHGITYEGPRSAEAVAQDLEREKRAYLARMRAVDGRLAGFLEDRRIVDENIDTVFGGADLRDRFPGFVTGMLTD